MKTHKASAKQTWRSCTSSAIQIQKEAATVVSIVADFCDKYNLSGSAVIGGGEIFSSVIIGNTTLNSILIGEAAEKNKQFHKAAELSISKEIDTSLYHFNFEELRQLNIDSEKKYDDVLGKKIIAKINNRLAEDIFDDEPEAY
ncbi:MAG: hypothetical protein IJS19_01070 [Muribaculaceae bacterium]|nr:hypothetical protein [Muribaculaceae bacterium]